MDISPKPFKEAFEGKRFILLTKIDVSCALLLNLVDGRVITDDHYSRIIDCKFRDEKYHELYAVLITRNDSCFPTFCNALKSLGQDDVVKILLSPPETVESGQASGTVASAQPVAQQLSVGTCQLDERVDRLAVLNIPEKVNTRLKYYVEPEYGLPRHLIYRGILTDEPKFRRVENAKDLCDNVEVLLDTVCDKLNDDQSKLSAFHEALTECEQSHVSKYILEKGERPKNCDDWPIEGVYENLLNHHSFFNKIDLEHGLLDLLLKRKCINDLQKIMVERQSNAMKSREYLIRLVKRKSIAIYDVLLGYLQVAQNDLYCELTSPGAVADIRTEVIGGQPKRRGSDVVESGAVLSNHEICVIEDEVVMNMEYAKRSLLERLGAVLCFLRLGDSIHWHFSCEDIISLVHLKELYDSGSLLSCLEDIVSSECDNKYAVRLRIQWSDDDYRSCLRYLDNSHFAHSPDVAEVVSLPVIVMETILIKAAVLRFKKDIWRTEAAAIGAVKLIVSVCRQWLFTLSDRLVAKHLRRTVFRDPFTLHFEDSIALARFTDFRARKIIQEDLMDFVAPGHQLLEISEQHRIAILDDCLFVARAFVRSFILAFSLTSSKINEIVPHNGHIFDIVACNVTRRVYFSTESPYVGCIDWTSADRSRGRILYVNENFSSHSLSVTRRQQLLVTGWGNDLMVLLLYDVDGELVRRVQLPDSVHYRPWTHFHAVQSTNDNFIVCRWNGVRSTAEVAEYDHNGVRVRSFDNRKYVFLEPCYLTLDYEGHVLVADREAGLVLLNSSLELVRVLLSKDELGGRAHQLCYKPNSRHLLITTNEGQIMGIYRIFDDWISLTTPFEVRRGKQRQILTLSRPASYSSYCKHDKLLTEKYASLRSRGWKRARRFMFGNITSSSDDKFFYTAGFAKLKSLTVESVESSKEWIPSRKHIGDSATFDS